MQYQIPNRPVPNIQIKPIVRPLAIAKPFVNGNIFAAMYSGGPCSSCGGK